MTMLLGRLQGSSTAQTQQKMTHQVGYSSNQINVIKHSKIQIADTGKSTLAIHHDIAKISRSFNQK